MVVSTRCKARRTTSSEYGLTSQRHAQASSYPAWMLILQPIRTREDSVRHQAIPRRDPPDLLCARGRPQTRQGRVARWRQVQYRRYFRYVCLPSLPCLPQPNILGGMQSVNGFRLMAQLSAGFVATPGPASRTSRPTPSSRHGSTASPSVRAHTTASACRSGPKRR